MEARSRSGEEYLRARRSGRRRWRGGRWGWLVVLKGPLLLGRLVCR